MDYTRTLALRRFRSIQERFYDTSRELHCKWLRWTERVEARGTKIGDVIFMNGSNTYCYRLLEFERKEGYMLGVRVRFLSRFGGEDKNDPGEWMNAIDFSRKNPHSKHVSVEPSTFYYPSL